MCSGTACVLSAPQEWTWQRELAQNKGESEWWLESRRRLAPFIAPLTLTFYHDQFQWASLVSGDRLLLIGTQSWEFYHPDNDYLYLVDLSSGRLVLDKPLNYRVGKLFCGPGEYAAFDGSRFNKTSRISTRRLVFLRVPSMEVIGEIDIEDPDTIVRSISIGGSLAGVRHEGQVAYFSLPVSGSDNQAHPGSILSPEEAERLKGEKWPREVLTPAAWAPTSLTWNDTILRISPIYVLATREGPPKATHTQPSNSPQ